MERTSAAAETVVGYSKAHVETELFEQELWGEIHLGSYETGSSFSEQDLVDVKANIDKLMEMVSGYRADGTWSEGVIAVTTGYGAWDTDRLADLKREIKITKVSTGEVLDKLLAMDYDIESEPEDGSGSVCITIELPDSRRFTLCGEGYYWMERYYNKTDGTGADVASLSDSEVAEAEENGVIIYDSSDIFWKSTFAARSYSAG